MLAADQSAGRARRLLVGALILYPMARGFLVSLYDSRYLIPRPDEFAGPATAHLFIVNPLHGAAATFMNLLSTHPPIEERIRRLEAMRV